MIYFILAFSLLFEVAVSNIVGMYTFLTPFFTLTALTMLYPYFNNKKVNFIITCTIIGFIYDVIFTDSLFINTLTFALISLLIILIYNYIKYNIINSSIINVIAISIYRIISYVLLLIVDYLSFNFHTLSSGIYNSLLINIVYGVLVYLFADVIARMFNIKKMKS